VGNDLVPIISKETLTPAEFSALADVPPETEWLANITNLKTRRCYQADVAEFVVFAGVNESAGLRTVARAHVIAWRKSLEAGNLTPASIRRKLSALSSLFEYLCERNAIVGNPVDGVKRPMANGNEGSTLPLATPRRAGSSTRRRPIRSRACATGPCWRPFYITASGARNSAGCECATCRAAREWCIFALRARAARSGSFQWLRSRSG
jgi:Phage integrase, N-terminal SAM-like domain